MKKYRLLSLCCSLLVLTGMTGCASSYDSTNSSRVYDTYYSEQTEAMEITGMTYKGDFNESTIVSETASDSIKNDLSSRKIIKNATLSFETKTYDEFMNLLEQCITGIGGYIESQEAYSGGIYSSRNIRNSNIIARIPADNYNRFMNDVCNIGTVTYRSESSSDVTMNYVDTESRIKSLETEYNALLEILDKATLLDDVIMLQSRISEVTYQLESYKSQIRKYDDLISYCTVNIDVSEVWRETQNVEVMSFGERIVSGLQDTFYDISEDLTDFSVWLITSLPYIVIWCVVILVMIFVIRRISASIKEKHKKKNEQKLIEQYYKQTNENQKND